MAEIEHRPFTCAGVGLKALEYLNDLEALGIRPSRMVSYPQPDDALSSFDAIVRFCKERNIPLEEGKRPTFRNDELVFLVGWQYLIRDTSPNLIVFHDSLLPKYRGFAPTVTAMINGEPRIGVTALKPVQEVDAGPIIEQLKVDIAYPMQIADALRLQARAMSRLTRDIIERYPTGMPDASEQNPAEATYSLWRDEDDYWLNWSEDAERLARTVDALGPPYQGARCNYQNNEIIIRQAHAVSDLTFEIRQPGKVWKLEDGAPVVVCGSGLLKILRAETVGGEPIRFGQIRSRFGGRATGS